MPLAKGSYAFIRLDLHGAAKADGPSRLATASYMIWLSARKCARCFIRDSKQPLEALGLPGVVCVENGDPVSGGLQDPDVPSASLPSVVRQSNEADAQVGSCNIPNNISGSIGRPVNDNDDFLWSNALGDSALKGSGMHS
jgi:hypothetical protein